MAEFSRLVFFLADEFNEDHASRVYLLVQHLGKKGRWPLGRPEVVDETDSSSCTRPEDVPIRTVGGVVPLHDRESSNTSEQQRDLERVTRVIGELARFSGAVGVTFEVQLDETYVGRVENGEPDRLIREGLLEPWAKELGVGS